MTRTSRHVTNATVYKDIIGVERADRLSRRPDMTAASRAVATGPAGPAAAGSMFGRIHKFSTTLFDLKR